MQYFLANSLYFELMHIFSLFGRLLNSLFFGPRRQSVGLPNMYSLLYQLILFSILMGVSLFFSKNSLNKSSPVIPIAFFPCLTSSDTNKGTSSPRTSTILLLELLYLSAKLLNSFRPVFFGAMNKITAVLSYHVILQKSFIPRAKGGNRTLF